jgi:hypothetical protein
MARVMPGSNTGERYWEGEGILGRGMIGGTGRSVREREREGVTGLGWLPGCGPSGLLASFFYFFLSVILFLLF